MAVPEVLTRCYENGEFTGKYGPLDPTRNFTYSFLNDLLSEIADVFPDKYLHLGGDENDFDCWLVLFCFTLKIFVAKLPDLSRTCYICKKEIHPT